MSCRPAWGHSFQWKFPRFLLSACSWETAAGKKKKKSSKHDKSARKTKKELAVEVMKAVDEEVKDVKLEELK